MGAIRWSLLDSIVSTDTVMRRFGVVSFVLIEPDFEQAVELPAMCDTEIILFLFI